MAKIGIVPMSAKPWHLGHAGLVRLAAKENDEVHLYVSTSDRDEVSGQAMAEIWKTQIEPTLPDNVQVTYGGVPVLNAFKDIGKASEENSTDTYKIYSDPVDAAANFGEDKLAKYASNLYKAGRIKTRPVERTSTVDISGTKMREFLKTGDKKSFLKFLPKDLNGDYVWDTLKAAQPQPKVKGGKGGKKAIKGEALLRQFVNLVVDQPSRNR